MWELDSRSPPKIRCVLGIVAKQKAVVKKQYLGIILTGGSFVNPTPGRYLLGLLIGEKRSKGRYTCSDG